MEGKQIKPRWQHFRNRRAQFQASLSTGIGYTIMVACSTYYVWKLAGIDVGAIYEVGLSAFGIMAALSGVCFTAAAVMEAIKEKVSFFVAGKRLLHASLLIAQTVFLKFVFTKVASGRLSWLSTGAHAILQELLQILLVSLGLMASLMALYGFQDLNGLLWELYLRGYEGKPEQNARKTSG